MLSHVKFISFHKARNATVKLRVFAECGSEPVVRRYE